MKNRKMWLPIVMAAIVVLALLSLAAGDRLGAAEEEVSVLSPKHGEAISSPVLVSGSAKGNWFFEANLRVNIVDWDGLIIAEGHATALDDWMTEGMVRFEGRVPFTVPKCGAGQDFCRRGAVIIMNDNPSGDHLLDKAFELPVIFE